MEEALEKIGFMIEYIRDLTRIQKDTLLLLFFLLAEEYLSSQRMQMSWRPDKAQTRRNTTIRSEKPYCWYYQFNTEIPMNKWDQNE